MAFDIAASAVVVQDALRAMTTDGRDTFASVEIERPGIPRGEGPSATIQFNGMRVVGTTLTNPIEVHNLTVRLWRAQNTAGGQSKELEATQITSQVLDMLYGDFTLGAGIRAVDVAGIYGDSIEARFEDEDIPTAGGNASYHIADITVPLIVDSATAFVA